MKALLFLNQTDGQQLAAEFIFRNYYKADTIVVKDLAGVSTGDLTTYIGTLDATYNRIFVTTGSSTGGGTGTFSHDQLAALLGKIHPDTLETISSAPADHVAVAPQANVTATEIVLKSDASAVDDLYNGWIIKVDVGALGTTFLYRYIKDYVGSTVTATVNTTTTAVTTTDKYLIYNPLLPGGPITQITTATAGYGIFANLYPHCALPRFIDELKAATAEYDMTATADSVANTSDVGSLTDADAFTASAYASGKYYVGIRSSTTGMGQIRRIISNTVSVLTLDAPWDPLPTGTIVYEITLDRWRCLNDYFLKYAMRYKFGAPYFSYKLAAFVPLIDINDSIVHTTTYTFQDLDALEALHDLGEQIMTSLGRGITS